MKAVNNVAKMQRILLVARNSGQQGSNARKAAATEAHDVVEDLYEHTGLDYRHLMPPKSRIVSMLKDRARAVRIASIDFETGRKFVNEYLVLHLTENVAILVSTGSGAKLDVDLRQPFLNFLNDLLRSYKPDLFIWHRIDRVFRSELLPALTLHYCKALKSELIDGETGRLDGELSTFMTLLRAREAAEEARRTPKKTRKGQASGTSLSLKEGSAAYAVAMSPPAGMMCLRMKAPNGQRGQGLLTFDTPDCYPDPAAVAYGMPEVFHHGRRVDQTALVRFALSKLGRPGWNISETARWMMERGYSTHRLRLMNTPSTSFTPEHVKGECERVLRSLIRRLEFYKTGVLEVRFGVKGVKDIQIDNCFPPDGPWAGLEDFVRIEAYLAQTRGGGPAALGLVGMVVVTDAGELPLRKAPKGRQGVSGASYVLRPAEAGLRPSVTLPALPHLAIAESMVEAIVLSGGSLLTPLIQHELDETADLRQALHEAEARAEQISRRCDAILASMNEVDEAGERVHGETTRKGLGAQYEAMVEGDLEPAKARVRELKADVLNATSAVTQEHPALLDALLLRIIASLRDPFNTEFNELWKSSARIERITRTPVKIHGHAGTITRWEGTIRIEGSGEQFVAPFSGEYLDGAAAGLPEKAVVALEQLLRGKPFREIKQTNASGVREALATWCAFDSRYFGLVGCRDPRLVTIAANLMVEPFHDPAYVALKLGEPVELVTSVYKQLTSGRPTWHLLRPTDQAA